MFSYLVDVLQGQKRVDLMFALYTATLRKKAFGKNTMIILTILNLAVFVFSLDLSRQHPEYSFYHVWLHLLQVPFMFHHVFVPLFVWGLSTVVMENELEKYIVIRMKRLQWWVLNKMAIVITYAAVYVLFIVVFTWLYGNVMRGTPMLATTVTGEWLIGILATFKSIAVLVFFGFLFLWLRLLTDHQIWALFMTIVFNFVFVWLLGSGWGTSFYFIGLPADHSHTVGHGMMIFVIYVGWIISISLLIFYVLEKRDLFYRENRSA